MAGRSLNTPGSLAPMACNACSRAPSGTRMACAMPCAVGSGQTLHPPASGPVAAEPDTPFPVLVIDESGIPKRGKHSAGVGPQYCGISGRVENCQVGVFLSYVTALGHGLIDRELYLPEDWCADAARRQARRISRSQSPLPPNPNWPSTCSSVSCRRGCPVVGWWLIPSMAIALTCARSCRSAR